MAWEDLVLNDYLHDWDLSESRDRAIEQRQAKRHVEHRTYSMNAPTPEQLDTLRHMLGINDRYVAEPAPYRDYYAAPIGDVSLWKMANAGLVERYAVRGPYEWYRTTPAGRVAAIESHKRIRAPKGKRLYVKFLRVRDCFPDLTFREFLTGQEFREARENA